jgi:hypothetical protein
VTRLRRRLASAISVATLATLPALAFGLVDGSAWAQVDAPQPDALVAGRALFADALADQDAGRLRAALDKFVRVKAVRDTSPVEYRIGACEEGLGHSVAAYDAYRSAVALGEGDAAMTEVVEAARARVTALSKHVARLTLVVPGGAGAGLAIAVDDVPVAPDALGRPIALEPGTHAVSATTGGHPAFRSDVSLPEGGEASLPVVPAPDPPAPVERPAPASPHRTLGWVLVGAGAALLVGSGVVWLLRHQDIASLNASCPAGSCATSQQGSIESTHDRAIAEGPVAGGLAAGGLASVVLGTCFATGTF